MATSSYDLIVYAGTPGGVIASVAAGRRGAKVLLIEQTPFVGGMNTNGINTAETENMNAGRFTTITGITEEFYRRIGKHFDIDDMVFYWQPRVALATFNAMLDEASVTVICNEILESAAVDSRIIKSITLESGATYEATFFMDCSYEGDLLAKAGISTTFGREAISTYDESLAGIRFVEDPSEVEEYHGKRSVDEVFPVSPYDDSGNLLPGVNELQGEKGDASPQIMNSHFRFSASSADNRIPFSEPDNYNPQYYELLRRLLSVKPLESVREILDFYAFPSGKHQHNGERWTPVPGEKWELNNKQSALFSLGHFGGNAGWLEGDTAARKIIWDDHKAYCQGLLYFLSTDPDVPNSIRNEIQGFGYDPEEFVDNNHCPYQIYLREGRRMIGHTVLTQHDVLSNTSKDDVIIKGTHKIDSHHIQRIAVGNDGFRNEGRIWKLVEKPFDVPYGCLIPKESECRNLFAPVPMSASHVAFCSIRLELVWMGLSHVAGTAASVCLDKDITPHDVDVPELQNLLREEGVKI